MQYYVIDIKVLIPVYSLLGIICILSNGLVCYILIARKVPNSAIKYYIFSLAMTDILVGAVCIPMQLWINWILFYKEMSLRGQTKILYTMLLVSEVFLSSLSISHLCLMAFDRVIAISKPIYHRQNLRKKSTALKLLVIPWLLATINTALYINLYQAPIDWAVLVAVTVIFPSCFIISCYSVLLHKIRKRNRAFSNVHNMKHIKEKRIIKTMLAVVITFAVCWMPVFAFSIYYAINIRHLPYYISIFLTLSTFMQYLNSACNPFIYAIFNPAFRTAINNAVRSIRGRTKYPSARKACNTNTQNNSPYEETKL